MDPVMMWWIEMCEEYATECCEYHLLKKKVTKIDTNVKVYYH